MGLGMNELLTSFLDNYEVPIEAGKSIEFALDQALKNLMDSIVRAEENLQRYGDKINDGDRKAELSKRRNLLNDQELMEIFKSYNISLPLTLQRF